MTNFTATIEEAEEAAVANGYLCFKGKYIPYRSLKKAIEIDAERVTLLLTPKRHTSLSVSHPDTNSVFIDQLEEALTVISQTADSFMANFEQNIGNLLQYVNKNKQLAEEDKASCLNEAERFGEDYLTLEKYVNLNLLGFHKILKKHDKNIPHRKLYQFYLAWLHKHKWLAGDYAKEIVTLSELFSKGFSCSSKKYWVDEESISLLKYTILQHIPVFRHDAATCHGDAQQINTVYLDNCTCELYHSRLDRRPGAQVIRLRWYGHGTPKQVYVERKVYHENWTGESISKERFCLPEEKVLPYLCGEYTWNKMTTDMCSDDCDSQDLSSMRRAFTSVQRKVQSAILRPSVRTQFYRTSFQLGSDPSVRISLDTNLRLYKELPGSYSPLWMYHWETTRRPLIPDCLSPRGDGARCNGSPRIGAGISSSDSETGIDDNLEFTAWKRDENKVPWRRTDQTHFPHAVLEVKLCLPEGKPPPDWLKNLTSGHMRLGYDVQKFSKYLHAMAVLFPQRVQAMPYWVDDESLRDSILMCSEELDPAILKPRTPDTIIASPLCCMYQNGPTEQLHGIGPRGGPLRRALGLSPNIPRRGTHAQAMKIEPKSFFANERVFLEWLHMATFVGSICASLLVFIAYQDTSEFDGNGTSMVQLICMILLPLACLLCFYALFIYLWRSGNISRASGALMNDQTGPIILGIIIILVLTAVFVLSLSDLLQTMKLHGQDAHFFLSCFSLTH